MKMTAVWQQVLATDARYNNYRAPNNPQIRTLYIRRRSQLLRENAKAGAQSQGQSLTQPQTDGQMRKYYLKLRTQLLAERYGANMSDQSSVYSRNTSIQGSKGNLEGSQQNLDDSLDVRGSHRRTYSKGSVNKLEDLGENQGLVPTKNADASRAMAGGTTIDENYAFAGMHHIFDQHCKAVTAVRFANEDKSRIACSSMDGTLSICQVLPSPATVVCVLKGHSQGVTDFSWSTSNDLILSCSLDGTACLWLVSSGTCVRTVKDPDNAPIRVCKFQPINNNMVVVGNGKGHIKVLNISTGKTPKGGLGKMAGQVCSLAFDDTGVILWAGDDRGVVFSFLFDVATGKLTKAKRTVICEGSPVTCISYRAWINREARDPSLLINCAVNSLCLYRIVGQDGGLRLRRTFSIKHKTCSIKSSFCPLMSFREGSCVVTGSEDMSVYFFDIERTSKPCVNKLQGHSAPVLAVCFNYDESLLASCDADGLIIIWKREQQKSR